MNTSRITRKSYAKVLNNANNSPFVSLGEVVMFKMDSPPKFPTATIPVRITLISFQKLDTTVQKF